MEIKDQMLKKTVDLSLIKHLLAVTILHNKITMFLLELLTEMSTPPKLPKGKW